MSQQAEETTRAVSSPPIILEEKKGRFKVKNVRQIIICSSHTLDMRHS